MTAGKRERWGLSVWSERGRTKSLHCSETTPTRLTLLPFLLSFPLLSSLIQWCSSGSSITNLWQKKISSVLGSAVAAQLWENTPFFPPFTAASTPHAPTPTTTHCQLPLFTPPTFRKSVSPPWHLFSPAWYFPTRRWQANFLKYTPSPLLLFICPLVYPSIANLTSPSIVPDLKNNHSSLLTYHNPPCRSFFFSHLTLPPSPVLLTLTPCYPPQAVRGQTFTHCDSFTGTHGNFRSIWIFRGVWCSVNCFLLASLAFPAVANCSYGCSIITMQWENTVRMNVMCRALRDIMLMRNLITSDKNSSDSSLGPLSKIIHL